MQLLNECLHESQASYQSPDAVLLDRVVDFLESALVELYDYEHGLYGRELHNGYILGIGPKDPISEEYAQIEIELDAVFYIHIYDKLQALREAHRRFAKHVSPDVREFSRGALAAFHTENKRLRRHGEKHRRAAYRRNLAEFRANQKHGQAASAPSQ